MAALVHICYSNHICSRYPPRITIVFSRTFFLPPGTPCGLDVLGRVSLRQFAGGRFLLALFGLLIVSDDFGTGLFLRLFGRFFRLFRAGTARRLFRREFCLFLRFFSRLLRLFVKFFLEKMFAISGINKISFSSPSNRRH